MAQQSSEDVLVHQARAVLDFNWTGEYTMPGPRLYPHQWSWDSAFIAIGYCRYDQDRATRELGHLFDAQWKNGLLPQLVFNPHFTNYFPGPNFWHAKESPDAPEHHETSGVVQPPLHATAALYIYRHAEDERRRRISSSTPSPNWAPGTAISTGRGSRGRGARVYPPPLGERYGQLPLVGLRRPRLRRGEDK